MRLEYHRRYDKKFISKTSRPELKRKRNSMQQVRGKGRRLIANSHERTAVRNRGAGIEPMESPRRI